MKLKRKQGEGGGTPFFFHEDFSGYDDFAHPPGWQVEQHTAKAHQHGYVEKNAYNIVYQGNKHIPLTPMLRDFELTFNCRGEKGASVIGVYIFFRYNRAKQSGYFVKREWGVNGAVAKFGVCGKDGIEVLESVDTENDFSDQDIAVNNCLRLEARDRTFTLYHNNSVAAVFTDENNVFPDAGHVGFDRGVSSVAGSIGPLFLSDVRIASEESFPVKTIWAEFTVEFPRDINGVASPFYYTIEAEELGGCSMLRVKLTGGPRERSEPVFDAKTSKHGFQNEKMLSPYVRLEEPGGGELAKFFLFRGSVGLSENWNRHATGLPPSDAECPLERAWILPRLPPDTNLFIGYEYYIAEERHWMKGGPTEALLDTTDGQVLYVGDALGQRAIQLEMISEENKKITSLIPSQHPLYGEALAFAENNHYFFESEPINLRPIVRWRCGIAEASELTLNICLEDVFRHPLKEAENYKLTECSDGVSDELRTRLGVCSYSPGPIGMSGLAVGVYHLRLSLYWGDQLFSETHRAFEVMSDDPDGKAAPLASGLPDLYCIEYSDFISSANGFEPKIGVGVNEFHYVSNSTPQFLFAKENRTWELARLYRRETAVVMGPHLGPDGTLSGNTGLIGHIDQIYPASLFQRIDLWKPHAYKNGKVFNVLLDFLRSESFNPREGELLSYHSIAEKSGISTPQFLELVEYNWKPWLLFFNQRYPELIREEYEQITVPAGANLKLWAFAAYPPYGSVYKSTYFLMYMGRDFSNGWADIYKDSNTLRFESYPYVCGYLIQRDVYMLASLKMAAPHLKLHPEVYSITGIPRDGYVALGSAPHANAIPPVACYRKRFFEYAYAAAWFSDGEFSFWDDRGFHPKHWDQDIFSEFLSAWSFISKIRPEKPLRTTCFVYSLEACMAHPDYIDERPSMPCHDEKPPVFKYDVYNTAEESVAFAYEQARMDGQPAGFVSRPEFISMLPAEDVDVLVLPPLHGVSEEYIGEIREKHEQGVNLLAFEDVGGLEDLFGVARRDKSTSIKAIRPSSRCENDHPLQELSGMTEWTDSPNCQSNYSCTSSVPLLDGYDENGEKAAPVLVLNRTEYGMTAFFTIPPTVVRRADGFHTYGSESMSAFINRATALTLRYISSPMVTTTQGKLIAFRDTQGNARIIVEEDNFPKEAEPISPLVTIYMPQVREEDVSCDKQFSIAGKDSESIAIRLHLEPHECAVITVNDDNESALR